MKKSTKELKKHTGVFGVWVEYNYYGNTYNSPKDGLLRDYAGYIVVSDSIDGILAEMDNESNYLNETSKHIYIENDEPYVFSHGEYARPTYMIVGLSDKEVKKAETV